MIRLNPARCLRVLAVTFATMVSALAAPALSAAEGDRLTLNFNPDWRFIKDDPAGASAPGFDDHAWAVVSTPHTYNDTDTFDNWSTPGHRGEQIQWGGRTWYRKSFAAPQAWSGKKVFIEFEAVRQIAEVYLNGEKLGTAKTGFTPFGFDLTPHLKVGAPNVLAVRVDNRFMKDPLDPATEAEIAKRNGTTAAAAPLSSIANPNLGELSKKVNETIPESLDDLRADQIPWNNPHWHPAHGGIYRNVRLIVTDPLRITLPLYSFLQTAGPYAYATDITNASANIGIEVPAQNDRASSENVELRAEVFDASGQSVLKLTQSQTIAAGARAEFKVSGPHASPRRWEPAGPAVWRGGYDSGKINSINSPFLDLEAGINRVAVRATRTAGKITVRAKSAGLRDASVTIASRPFAAEGGYSTDAPVAPPVKLPAVAPTYATFASAAVGPVSDRTHSQPPSLGKFIKTFNYTGPEAAIVHVEIGARDGRNIYIDRDYTFASLPANLVGADWIQVADADQRYSAVDLIELAVPAGSVVTIAHDDRAPLPGWLTKQFQPTDQTLTIHGQAMKLFERRVAKDESLTLGSNTEGAPVRANQYVVLVNGK